MPRCRGGGIASVLCETDGSEAAEFTAGGLVHAISGVVSILAMVVAAWMFRGVFSRDSGYKHLSRTQHWFAVVLTGALVGGVVLEEAAPGLAQRVFAVVMVGWWIVLAVSVGRSEMPRHLSEDGPAHNGTYAHTISRP